MMNYIFNKEKIQQLLSDFYISTEIATTLYDAAMEPVATSPVFCECCRCIRSGKDGTKYCDCSNLSHMEEAKAQKAPVFYACHAGLMETVTPIFYENTLIAYIQTGQFRDAQEVFSSRKKLLDTEKRCGFPAGTLVALYEKVPVISREKLRAHLNIMDVVIKSFWADGLILCNRSMLSVRIEQYIHAHLSEKIGIEDLTIRFYLSKNALYRLFHDEFHVTVNEYITQARLTRAQQLLKDPSLELSQVSAMCGFSDYNYFIRVFKKQLHTTPLQFKKAVTDSQS